MSEDFDLLSLDEKGQVGLVLRGSVKGIRSWHKRKSREYKPLTFNDQLSLFRSSLRNDSEGWKKLKYMGSFGLFIPDTTISNYDGTLVAHDGERQEEYLADLVYEYERSSEDGVFHSMDDKTRLLGVNGQSDWLGNDSSHKQFLELLTGLNGATQGLEGKIKINLIEKTFTHRKLMIPAIKLVDGNPTIDFLPEDYHNTKSRFYSLGRRVQAA